MTSIPASVAALPELQVPAGTCLIVKGVPMGRVYILKEGAFMVERDGVRVVSITDPGAFMGEMSALLGTPPSADVVATQDSVVHVLENGTEAVRGDPELLYAIAQLLARRLQGITAYLVDIKRQYADTNTHLALMDTVLAELMSMPQAASTPAGSERSDVPDY